jgi:hypothetical protein
VVGPGILLLVALPAVLGLPLGCIGLILRLCEWSWEKPAGSMGSTRLLVGSGLLCAPVVAYPIWAHSAAQVRLARRQ